MEGITAKRNFVFISYNHKDVKWAKWLQRKLEWYRLPTEIHNEFSDSRYLRPVFRDRDELTSGVLNDELRNYLEVSKYLVVLCSPHSAQSEWVSEEIRAFVEWGRLDKIVPFIIEGSPQDYSNTDVSQSLIGECFPLTIRKWNTEHPDKELLGISVYDDGRDDKQKAFVKLVAHLLGVEFDALWQRHKRYVHSIITCFICLVAIIAMLFYWFVIPIKLSVTIKDEQCKLPGMEYGVLTVNGSEYSLARPDTTINIASLPGYYRMRKVPIFFHAGRFYNDEAGFLPIGMGISQHMTIQLHRDNSFAIFSGIIYEGGYNDGDLHPINEAIVVIDEYETISDENGRFRIVIPLEEQEEFKPIRITKPGYHPFEREDECPSKELKYILHRL